LNSHTLILPPSDFILAFQTCFQFVGRRMYNLCKSKFNVRR
jgi:hypothetical protein